MCRWCWLRWCLKSFASCARGDVERTFQSFFRRVCFRGEWCGGKATGGAFSAGALGTAKSPCHPNPQPDVSAPFATTPPKQPLKSRRCPERGRRGSVVNQKGVWVAAASPRCVRLAGQREGAGRRCEEAPKKRQGRRQSGDGLEDTPQRERSHALPLVSLVRALSRRTALPSWREAGGASATPTVGAFGGTCSSPRRPKKRGGPVAMFGSPLEELGPSRRWSGGPPREESFARAHCPAPHRPKEVDDVFSQVSSSGKDFYTAIPPAATCIAAWLPR